MTPASVSICVFCGARSGQNPAFASAATEFGNWIATKGWRLVYGAGDVGLMGEVGRAAQSAGGVTMGVIPTSLLHAERGKTDLTQFIITETMHERKKVMFMNADAFVILPGGGGSLDEFFEVLTWAQIGLHHKPMYLFNVDGYWQPLIDLLDHVVSHGFADTSMLDSFQVADTQAELVALLQRDFA